MSKFDNFCAVLPIPFGVLFLWLGILGVFRGASANFSLPAGLGALPFFVGWVLCGTQIKFWRQSRTIRQEARELPPLRRT